jgi:thiamine biosynthesis lipoprotein
VTRAQPWLGTLVEVALPPDDATDARFDAAFAAIAHVHRRMNAHDAASDLQRIARFAHRRPVAIDRQTFAVLALAQQLARATRGCFDVTVPALGGHRGGRCRTHSRHGQGADGMRALHLRPGLRVHTESALRLDLSGIAKGHAVDRAVAALRRAGAGSGLVNAGGDLCVFGADVWLPVRVRLPQSATLALPLFEVRLAAVATSADYFRDHGGALFDPRSGRVRPFDGSISVVAPTCALADALTKVVALMPARAAPLLARCGAQAFRIDANSRECATTCHASTSRVRLHAA